ncbi:MAG: TlpA family protein disulfide reductase [Alphaproteobacteria bacterium]|nr:TlpA family protein disulfide reductase [Alphaproteobacteria bacterium]
MLKWIWNVLVILFFISTLSNCMNRVRIDYSSQKTLAQRNIKVPSIKLESYDSSEFKLPTKPSVIVFFASWCKPCLLEMDTLNEIAKTKNIELIGIAFKDDKKRLTRTFSKISNPFSKIGIDIDGDYARSLRIYGIPTVLIFDGKETFTWELGGFLTDENFDNLILPKIKSMNEKDSSK